MTWPEVVKYTIDVCAWICGFWFAGRAFVWWCDRT